MTLASASEASGLQEPHKVYEVADPAIVLKTGHLLCFVFEPSDPLCPLSV
jgi:hypothetical protein